MEALAQLSDQGAVKPVARREKDVMESREQREELQASDIRVSLAGEVETPCVEPAEKLHFERPDEDMRIPGLKLTRVRNPKASFGRSRSRGQGGSRKKRSKFVWTLTVVKSNSKTAKTEESVDFGKTTDVEDIKVEEIKDVPADSWITDSSEKVDNQDAKVDTPVSPHHKQGQLRPFNKTKPKALLSFEQIDVVHAHPEEATQTEEDILMSQEAVPPLQLKLVASPGKQNSMQPSLFISRISPDLGGKELIVGNSSEAPQEPRTLLEVIATPAPRGKPRSHHATLRKKRTRTHKPWTAHRRRNKKKIDAEVEAVSTTAQTEDQTEQFSSLADIAETKSPSSEVGILCSKCPSPSSNEQLPKEVLETVSSEMLSETALQPQAKGELKQTRDGEVLVLEPPVSEQLQVVCRRKPFKRPKKRRRSLIGRRLKRTVLARSPDAAFAMDDISSQISTSPLSRSTLVGVVKTKYRRQVVSTSSLPFGVVKRPKARPNILCNQVELNLAQDILSQDESNEYAVDSQSVSVSPQEGKSKVLKNIRHFIMPVVSARSSRVIKTPKRFMDDAGMSVLPRRTSPKKGHHFNLQHRSSRKRDDTAVDLQCPDLTAQDEDQAGESVNANTTDDISSAKEPSHDSTTETVSGKRKSLLRKPSFKWRVLGSSGGEVYTLAHSKEQTSKGDSVSPEDFSSFSGSSVGSSSLKNSKIGKGRDCPRIKHVCRDAAVVLGQPRAMVPDDVPRLSALPLHEREKIPPSPMAQDVSPSEPESPTPQDQKMSKTRKLYGATGGRHRSTFSSFGLRSRRCGRCKGCLHEEDCGKCMNCLDKPKFGGPNTKRQCCAKRRRSSFSACNSSNDEGDATEGGRSSPTVLADGQSPSLRKQPRRCVKPRSYCDLLDYDSDLDMVETPNSASPRRRSLSHRNQGSTKTLTSGELGNLNCPLYVDVMDEDCSLQNVWLMGGLSILTSIPVVPPYVCLLCASKGHHEMLYCQVCCEPFHQFCLEPGERPLEENKENWCCRRCKFCHVCGRRNKHSKPLLECERCQNCYHPSCLGPNYPKPNKKSCNKKSWVCMTCIRCKSCGVTPGKSWDTEWNHERGLCPDCSKLYDQGNYCPICHKCYEDNDYDSQMMQCATCNHWVHAKCEDLSDDLYEILSRLPESVVYSCQPCSQTHPSDWRELLHAELKAGVEKVLACLLTSTLTQHLCTASVDVDRGAGDHPACDLRTVGKKFDRGLYASLVSILLHLPTSYSSCNHVFHLFYFTSKTFHIQRAFLSLLSPTPFLLPVRNHSMRIGMLPNAVLPPSAEHLYAQWREREEHKAYVTTGLQNGDSRETEFKTEEGLQLSTPLTSKPEDERQCSLCQKYGDAKDAGRLLYLGQNEWAHVNCSMWSAEVFEEDNGSLMHVHSAVARGRLMRCERCNQTGATVGCCLTSCQSNYHFMCARARNCVFQDDKKVFCYKHRDLISGKMVTGQEFEVLRRVYVDFEGISLRRKFLTGLEPESINMMIGSLQIDKFGVLTELSESQGKLFPVGYQCSRWFWSTVDPRRRCKYTCRVREVRPPVQEKPVEETPDQGENRTIAHGPCPHIGQSPKSAHKPSSCFFFCLSKYQPTSVPTPPSKPDPATRPKVPSYAQTRRPAGGMSRPLPSPGDCWFLVLWLNCLFWLKISGKFSFYCFLYFFYENFICCTVPLQQNMFLGIFSSYVTFALLSGVISSSDDELPPPELDEEYPSSKDQPHLRFEITSEDGFIVEADSIEVAWKAVIDGVQEARAGARLKQLSFMGMSGARMMGLLHDAVVFLVEQLQGASSCQRHTFRFHKQDNQEEELPVNPSGCARSEVYIRKSTFDMFNFLASQHRQLPDYGPYDEEDDEVPLKSTRRATSMELPMAMRFRHLERTSKEAVGVYRSAIHGRGLFCKRNIDAGEMVIEYSGIVIRSVLTDKREKYYDGKGIGCYMFRIDDFDVVDATMHGNAARFINHSCEPNCYSRVINVEGQKHIVIFALRKIYRGEELTYDYKFPIEDASNKLNCNCGARRCRRFLN
uniref:[histone H3]-lysine(4) N-methyltransferase n=1 Tax=Scleropages formosus TaxID=113540 RepID=A0A8C9VMV8_SCLFO